MEMESRARLKQGEATELGAVLLAVVLQAQPHAFRHMVDVYHYVHLCAGTPVSPILPVMYLFLHDCLHTL